MNFGTQMILDSLELLNSKFALKSISHLFLDLLSCSLSLICFSLTISFQLLSFFLFSYSTGPPLCECCFLKPKLQFSITFRSFLMLSFDSKQGDKSKVFVFYFRFSLSLSLFKKKLKFPGDNQTNSHVCPVVCCYCSFRVQSRKFPSFFLFL